MLPIHIYNQIILNEEQRKDIQRNYNIQRRILREDSDPFSMTEEEFVGQFRLTKHLVQHIILPNLMPAMDYSSSLAIDPVKRTLLTLALYGSGEYQRCIGGDFKYPVSQPTVSNCIREVTRLLVDNLCQQWIQFPTGIAEVNRVKALFMEKNRFPGVLGCIDCTHVPILAPVEQEHNYVNRKGIHTKNVQLFCDSNCRILNVNSRFPGATHDAFIFRQSGVSAELERMHNEGNYNTWLLGDSGYPQKPYLMTPIINAIPGSPDFNYTSRHVRTRVCIERCNALLKSRFRCLSSDRKLRYAPDICGNIINACCILHNICIDGNLDQVYVAINEIQDDIEGDIERLFFQNNQDAGFQARRQLIQRYFT